MTSSYRKAVTVAAIILILVGAAWYALEQRAVRLGEKPPAGTGIRGENVYSVDEFKFSFAYPNTYHLEEYDLGNGERQHVSVAITDNDATIAPDSEGPTAITVDVYQNDLDKLTSEQWITTTGDSNWKLATSPLERVEVGGKEALSYRWSGLYEAETTVFEHADNIIAVTVTFIAPEDAIRSDYARVLSTFEFVQ